jgi:hypothetical protein
MMFSYLGLPTIEGKEDLGASSPERPALHIPEPLSITTGTPFSSDIPINLYRWEISSTQVAQIVLHQKIKSEIIAHKPLKNKVKPLQFVALIPDY